MAVRNMILSHYTMPGKTDRARALESLSHMRKRILIHGDDSDSDGIDEAMKENIELTVAIQSRRYFERPIEYRNKGVDANDAFQEWINDRRIVVYTHMSRRSLDYVYQMIRESPVFVNPSVLSPSRQRSIYFQLFVCLSSLTGDGDGACIDRLNELFNIGHGTISIYNERCIAAINEHVDAFVCWPNAARRAELATYGDVKYGFPGFIASCDGTMIGLRRAPAFNMFPETYCHPRHKGYGFNVLFWVDHHGTIIRFTCNWPASAADQTIFNASLFATNPWLFLKQHEEYIFVDLGFKKETFAVPPYKGQEGKLKHNAQFNVAQRKGRVKVEHANGVIKARFGSLRHLPIEIREASDHDRCAAWITTCVILHNLLISIRDEWEPDAIPAVVEEEDDDLPEPAAQDVSAKMFCNAVRDRWLEQHGGWERR